MAEKSLYNQNQKWLLNVNMSLNLVTICLLQNLKNLTEISKILGKMEILVFVSWNTPFTSFGPDSSHLAQTVLIWPMFF